ncbi:uncharacterized protein LOC106174682 [Lingula anatina]|uniref:Uncharacterized protein LOC106174682 n=1 Tax=Lingula anatina TaxID=7574 RepID=A0A1S3JP69_LINAN|nr:uncharacterized protein LOC106174682 [Lingula anatina]|eukprot:XP_013411794.1 uncharacterized protein LOC106174682 [Lingula anatina]
MVEYLKQWHRPRMEILVNSGVDLLAFETLPAVLEAKALVELLREFPHSRAWVAYSCKDGGHTHHGEPMSQGVEAVLDCSYLHISVF